MIFIIYRPLPCVTSIHVVHSTFRWQQSCVAIYFVLPPVLWFILCCIASYFVLSPLCCLQFRVATFNSHRTASYHFFNLTLCVASYLVLPPILSFHLTCDANYAMLHLCKCCLLPWTATYLMLPLNEPDEGGNCKSHDEEVWHHAGCPDQHLLPDPRHLCHCFVYYSWGGPETARPCCRSDRA